ncbi:MAG: hypothetical protein CMD09_04935 [Flavobacteriales bacterium]|nr:hypothetical protein [Flavobacteriales bacterium]
MATLTYDANEAQEGELSAEEQDSLKVGEALAEQEDKKLAGKFEDAEALEKAYIELQSKLGEPKEEKAEVKEEKTEAKEEVKETKEEEPDYEFLDKLWEESKNEKYSDDLLDKLNDMNPADVAQLYLNYRSGVDSEPQELTQEQATDLQKSVGGEKQYNTMLQWASNNFDESEISRYDKVMESGDPDAAYFAVQALAAKYNDGVGVEGKMLTGKPAADKGDNFRSQAEVVRAMSDPRYEADPAYRQDIYDKLERSNLKF